MEPNAPPAIPSTPVDPSTIPAKPAMPVDAALLAGSVPDHDMTILGLFMQADIIVQAVIVLLILASFWSWRSEEHTSELQSLMRISYAVFCLKKKKNKRDTIVQISNTETTINTE